MSIARCCWPTSTRWSTLAPVSHCGWSVIRWAACSPRCGQRGTAIAWGRSRWRHHRSPMDRRWTTAPGPTCAHRRAGASRRSLHARDLAGARRADRARDRLSRPTWWPTSDGSRFAHVRGRCGRCGRTPTSRASSALSQRSTGRCVCCSHTRETTRPSRSEHTPGGRACSPRGAPRARRRRAPVPAALRVRAVRGLARPRGRRGLGCSPWRTRRHSTTWC